MFKFDKDKGKLTFPGYMFWELPIATMAMLAQNRDQVKLDLEKDDWKNLLRSLRYSESIRTVFRALQAETSVSAPAGHVWKIQLAMELIAYDGKQSPSEDRPDKQLPSVSKNSQAAPIL